MICFSTMALLWLTTYFLSHSFCGKTLFNPLDNRSLSPDMIQNDLRLSIYILKSTRKGIGFAALGGIHKKAMNQGCLEKRLVVGLEGWEMQEEPGASWRARKEACGRDTGTNPKELPLATAATI